MFIHTKPDSPTPKSFYKKSLAKGQYKFWKKSISCRGAALRKEIEQSLKILLHVTFCKHYKDRLLNYE